MLEGIILKAYSSFYYVKHQDEVFECSLRGKNKLKKIRFLPGDRVEFEKLAEKKGVIEDLKPRLNELIRPPIANIEQVIIVCSLANPSPDLMLVDRLTSLALWNNAQPVICFNKNDLVQKEYIDVLQQIYLKAGFQVVICSSKNKTGIDLLKKALKDKISVFAGPSGVGKTSLFNALVPGLNRETGQISSKLKRGKHTTRHVELINLGFGGLLADTPGFSSLHLPSGIVREELDLLFPDIRRYAPECRFSNCLHKNEPKCAVKEAVEKGELEKNRYNNYLVFLEEVIEQERSF